MPDWLAGVRAYIERHKLLSPGDRVLIGLSGGVDSVVLLHALRRLGYAVGAAHLDHGLRPESAEEAARVLAWCREWGVPAVASRVDLSRFASGEEAAREARYVYLNRVAREEGYGAIALGHHVCDQAETVLFRLARGTGLTGLAGMRPRRMQASGLPVVRPLLAATRGEIVEAAQAWGLPWLEDASNRDLSLARNRIRHQALPALAAVNGEAARHIATTADMIHEEVALEEESTRRLANYMTRLVSAGLAEIDRRALLALPEARARRVLRLVAERLGGGFDRVACAAAIAACQSGRAADVAGGWHVEPTEETLVLRRPWSRPAPVPFAGPGPQPTEAWGWRVRVGPPTPAAASPLLVRFDAERLPAGLVWRTAEPDTDVFTPWGQRRAHSLRHFLTREHLAAHRQEALLVLASEERVLWVVGWRRGGDAALERTPENVWEMQATAGFPV